MTTWVFPACRPEQHGQPRPTPTALPPGRRRVRFVTQAGRLSRRRPRSPPPEGNGGPLPHREALRRRLPRGAARRRHRLRDGRGGGTSFWNHRWNPGDDLYDNLVALTRPSWPSIRTGACGRMLFQGFETDAKNAMLADDLPALPRPLVRGIRADLGAPELPIVFGELPPAFVDGRPDRSRDPRRAPR